MLAEAPIAFVRLDVLAPRPATFSPLSSTADLFVLFKRRCYSANSFMDELMSPRGEQPRANNDPAELPRGRRIDLCDFKLAREDRCSSTMLLLCDACIEKLYFYSFTERFIRTRRDFHTVELVDVKILQYWLTISTSACGSFLLRLSILS